MQIYKAQAGMPAASRYRLRDSFLWPQVLPYRLKSGQLKLWNGTHAGCLKIISEVPTHELPVRLHGNPGAIASAHQDAILGFEEIGDAHGEPNPACGQRHGERECCDIGQHTTESCVFVTRPFVAREVAGRRPAICGNAHVVAMPRGLVGGTRPEFEHHVLVIPWYGPLLYGPLGFHCRRSTKSFFCLACPLYFQHEILCRQTQVSLRTVSWNLP